MSFKMVENGIIKKQVRIKQENKQCDKSKVQSNWVINHVWSV